MKKNIEELTRSVNEFRMANQSKTFLPKDLTEKLMELGFNRASAKSICQKVFPFETMGRNRLYSVPKEPIHKSIIAGIYSHINGYKKSRGLATQENDMFQEGLKIQNAIKLLLSKGYKVSKPVGLDIDLLVKENPKLAEKYMKYQQI